MSYRGHVKGGQILLEEPVRLPEGAQVQVEVVALSSLQENWPDPSDDINDIDQWDRDWRRLGPMQYAPGEREEVEKILAEADLTSKMAVRREMEHGA